MKILWLTWKDRKHPLAGGAELVNEELAKRLAKDGHEVVFIVGGFKDSKGEEMIDGFKVIRLGNRYTLYWKAYRYYTHHLVGWADLVIDEVNTIPFFAKFYVKEPVIMFFHMLCREIWFYEMIPPFSLVGYIVEPLYLRLFSKLPAIAVSESTKNDLIRLGYYSKNIHIISEGIELDPVKDLKEIKKYPQPTVLSLGALKSMKRTLHQIKAFELAKHKIPDLQLKIAGAVQEKYGHKVLAAIFSSPHKNDIEYLGKVSKQQKIELMQKCHVLIQTAVKEGWGLTVTEAASQSTPAVAYNVDGLRDSTKNGKTGLVTDSNPKAIANGIVKLFKEQTLYDELQRAAWIWSRNITFSQSYIDFYEIMSKVII